MRYVRTNVAGSSGAGTIRHEGARAPPLWEMAENEGAQNT